MKSNLLTTKFSLHADSVDVSNALVAVGLSNLEGNIWDGGIKLLNSESGEELYSMHCECGISMVRFTGQNKSFLLSARDDGHIGLYASSTLDHLFLFPAHDDFASAISVDEHNETQFISCGWDGCIKIWDWQSDNKETPVSVVKNAHYRQISDVAFNKQNNSVFGSTGQDGFFRVWDRRQNIKEGCAQIVNHHQPISCLEWDSSSIVTAYTGTDAGTLQVVDIRMNREPSVESSTMFQLHKGRIRRIRSLSQAAGSLLTVSDDANLVVSKITSLGEVREDHPPSGYQLTVKSREKLHKDYISDLAVMQESSGMCRIATTSTDKSLHLSELNVDSGM